MQGFNYAQLYQALQDWPVKASATYLAQLNRMIYLGELRLATDLDLEYFDPTDTVTLAPGATTIPKPPGSQAIAFTGIPAQNATSATLTGNWTGVTGVYVVTFSDNELRAVTLTNAATTATWPGGLAAAQTAATGQVNSQFIAERDLWVTYSGALFPVVKRSAAFVKMYQAAVGRPLYYCELTPNTWAIAPTADTNVSAATRHYIQRPQSIVVAGNTYFGDNFGQLLFCCCLMEAEHFLKADDRYGDMRTKYGSELLPNARDEVRIAMRNGDYAPLRPVASLPAPPMPQQAPQQGQ